MARWVADTLHERRGGRTGSAIVLGLTFKENVPDLRNSRAFDLVARLAELGYDVAVADPIADPDEIARASGLGVSALDGQYDLVVGAVAHDRYRAMPDAALAGLLRPGGLIADLRGMWRDRQLPANVERWTL